MVEAETLHRLCADLWPAAESEALGPWLLRADPSVTKRANALGIFGPPDRPLAEAFAQARLWQEARGKRPVAQILLDGGPVQLWLEARGAAFFDETCVLLRPSDGAAAPSPGLSAESAEEPPEVWAQIESHGAADFPARLAVMRRVSPERRRFVTLREAERALGVAFVAATADLALIAAVSVRPEARGRGVGRALMAAALEAAQGLGAARAAVQVEARNDRARALYARLGFREAYRYAYAEIP